MNKPHAHYELLGELFYYPRDGYAEHVHEVRELLENHYPSAAVEFAPFAEFVHGATQTEIEELYTRSFDVQSVTTLDVGYVLFGDDYKRGELLSNLNREHNLVKQDCRDELADHLSNILGLLARVEDAELHAELVSIVLGPALDKMIGEFDPERLTQKNELYKKHYKTLIETPEKNPLVFQYPLRVLRAVLREDFQYVTEPEKIQTTDFLRSVRTEMETEHEHDK